MLSNICYGMRLQGVRVQILGKAVENEVRDDMKMGCRKVKREKVASLRELIQEKCVCCLVPQFLPRSPALL